ncbi:MAG TPA: phosphoribosylglycinamide formyltransferase [Saprospiraceae bacterium]|nr:phosphoribosylglycinamide formyltransferase [Saprospiraceae bacterium]HMP13772.1 phosphoribosylglycinamide formyltransferase [Saprospiraceae bacterium]
MKNIAIFASGTGSNAAKIVAYFRNNPHIQVRLIVSNRSEAPVLNMARAAGIETLVVWKHEFYDTQNLLQILHARQIVFIALAGFLWLIPDYLVRAYPQRIVNIHPALLPRYGGKGMYGRHVHEAVKAAGESESGITIHYVNERYDEGDIIFQKKCILEPNDTSEDIAHKVQALEHRYFAPLIEQLLLSDSAVQDTNSETIINS